MGWGFFNIHSWLVNTPQLLIRMNELWQSIAIHCPYVRPKIFNGPMQEVRPLGDDSFHQPFRWRRSEVAVAPWHFPLHHHIPILAPLLLVKSQRIIHIFNDTSSRVIFPKQTAKRVTLNHLLVSPCPFLSTMNSHFPQTSPRTPHTPRNALAYSFEPPSDRGPSPLQCLSRSPSCEFAGAPFWKTERKVRMFLMAVVNESKSIQSLIMVNECEWWLSKEGWIMGHHGWEWVIVAARIIPNKNRWTASQWLDESSLS